MPGNNPTSPWRTPCLVLVFALLAGCQKPGRIADPGDADDLLDFSDQDQNHYGTAVAYEHTIRAELLAEQGNPAGAADYIEKALASDPEDHYLHIRLAGLLIQTGALKKARRQINRVLKKDPGNASAWLASAMYYRAVGDDRKAVAAARRAMKVNPAHFGAALWLAETYLEMGDIQLALKILRHLVTEAPENADAHLKLGETSLAMGNRHEAARHLARFLKLRPYRADVVTTLAGIYLSSGDRATAATLFEMALRQNPADTAARKTLIALLIELGQKKTAIDHIRSLPPGAPDADTLEMACFYAAADNPYTARDLIVSFFGPSPQDLSARMALAKVERVLGRLESADILLEDPAIQWTGELLDEKEALLANRSDWAETRFLPCR
ncbi:MAG: tetratricopeptide repeat protein [Proteobacteria bacterium]|nr:tetratricopeptide repeat protein [Pseudomonadota bacterium]